MHTRSSLCTGDRRGPGFDTTPDGREGWRTLFVRYGFPAYVVDEAGVARSSSIRSL